MTGTGRQRSAMTGIDIIPVGGRVKRRAGPRLRHGRVEERADELDRGIRPFGDEAAQLSQSLGQGTAELTKRPIVSRSRSQPAGQSGQSSR